MVYQAHGKTGWLPCRYYSPRFFDLNQKIGVYGNFSLKLFVRAHKKSYLCTRNKK